jgi:hypothetical protein
VCCHEKNAGKGKLLPALIKEKTSLVLSTKKLLRQRIWFLNKSEFKRE